MANATEAIDFILSSGIEAVDIVRGIKAQSPEVDLVRDVMRNVGNKDGKGRRSYFILYQCLSFTDLAWSKRRLTLML